MLLKDMKPGYPVYLLDKSDGIKALQGRIVKVGDPYYPPVQQGQFSASNTTQRFVDVTLEARGITHTYSIPETLSVTYANESKLVISSDKEGILREVESIKNRNDEELRMVEKRKEENAACEKIMEEWNPAFAEKREQDKRIAGLESKVDGLGKMLEKFINELKN